MDNDKNIVLFGSGEYGKKALQYFGPNRVYCFVSNNEKSVGKKIYGIPVISFQQLKIIYKNYQIIISTNADNALAIAAQLEDAGISQYEIFLKILQAASKERPAEITVQNQSALDLEEKNRALMVVYCFPPLSGAGVFRPIKFVKYLPQFGWHPTVITTGDPHPRWGFRDESLLKEIPVSVPVIRIPDPLGTLQEIFTQQLQNQVLDFLENVLQESKEAHALYISFIENKEDIAKLLLFPCPALFWAYKTVQYIEAKMNIHDFRVIYTTSAPYSTHLVGYYFKHKYGIPWVADYRDQWTGNPFLSFDPSKPYDRLCFFMESILLRNADCNITFGLSGVIKDYISRFQLPEKKIISITNGFDEEDFAPFNAEARRTDKFTISYSGVIYGNRSIDAILVSLQELIAEGQIDLEKVRFRIVGESWEYDPVLIAQRFNLESIIVQTGYLSHSEAIQSNIEANLLLLLIGEDEQFQYLPSSKIFEYLRSGRPILSLSPSGGLADQLLRETGHGKAFISTQIPEIKAMILEEYKKWERGGGCELLCSPLIKQFERKYLTGKLVQIFENV